MTSERDLELACPAKVNLALSVGGPRADGFHPIASWMVAVTFADTLGLSRLAQGPSQFDLSFADDAPVPSRVDWPIEKDLAFRAHRMMEESAGRSLPIRLTLRKRIPAGAGLGGGSSNAAATLVGVNRRFELKMTDAALRSLAQRLGSDVAFLVDAILGRPSAIVTGLGESLQPAPLHATVHLVLIFPGFGCPTGAVYKAFDQSAGAGLRSRVADEASVTTLARRSPLPPDGPFNDLAQPAFAVRPELASIQRRVVDELRVPVHVTGSGSTLFIVAPDEHAATSLARQASAITSLATLATRTL